MENIIENGTNILVFKKINGIEVPNKFTLVKGTIINSEQKEYECMNGSPLVKQIYTVQGENGEIYKASYGDTVDGYYIRTIEDYSKYIRLLIKEKIKKLRELTDETEQLNNLQHSLEQLIEKDKLFTR